MGVGIVALFFSLGPWRSMFIYLLNMQFLLKGDYFDRKCLGTSLVRLPYFILFVSCDREGDRDGEKERDGDEDGDDKGDGYGE
jgi:hypothetical protein